MRFRAPSLCLLAALAIVISGCEYVVFLGLLFGGRPSIEPDYDTRTGKSLTDKDVVVAVVCFAPKELLLDYSRIDRSVGKFVSYRLHQHEISTINPDLVQAWMDEHPDWDRPEEIGEAVGATHVIYIDITQYSLYAENSHELYRGRSESIITVYEIDETGEGEPIYSKELPSRYPLAIARDASEISRPGFQAEYHERLSEEIGRLFYEYYRGDDVSAAT